MYWWFGYLRLTGNVLTLGGEPKEIFTLTSPCVCVFVCAPRFRTGVSRLSLFSLIFPSSLSLSHTLPSFFFFSISLQTFSFGARVVGKFGLTVRESPGEPCIRVIRNER